MDALRELLLHPPAITVGDNYFSSCVLKYLGAKSHTVYNLFSNDSAKNKTKQPRASITHTDKYGTMLMIIESDW